MLRRLAFAALFLTSATVVSAQPTASLPIGYTFVDWLTVNNATVGNGAVDDDFVVYYLKEKQIGNLQSWLIFFDPATPQSVMGTITFGQSINTLFTSSTDVNTTSAAYRLGSVTYASANLTGLEDGDAASFAGNTLTINWTAADPGDHVRVLTNVVPEPSTYALMALGLTAMGVASRTRRTRA